MVEAKLWSGDHHPGIAGPWQRANHVAPFTDPHDQLITPAMPVREYVSLCVPGLVGEAGAVPRGLLVPVQPDATVWMARSRRQRPIVRTGDATRRLCGQVRGQRRARAPIARLAAILTPTARAIGDN